MAGLLWNELALSTVEMRHMLATIAGIPRASSGPDLVIKDQTKGEMDAETLSEIADSRASPSFAPSPFAASADNDSSISQRSSVEHDSLPSSYQQVQKESTAESLI